MELMRGLVVPDEQVVAPGLVAWVGEIRREQRVHVATWLERRAQQAHPRLIHEAAALAVIAVFARSHEVVPRVCAAAMPRNDVIERQVVRLDAAVLAGVLVANEDFASAQTDARTGTLDSVLESNDRRCA